MPYTFDSALDDELITVLSRSDEMGEFEVRVDILETPVAIELGRFMTSDHTMFRVSHAIHTPSQAGPYRTSTPHGGYPAYALHKAVSGLPLYYKNAVKDGHVPSESWLVE